MSNAVRKFLSFFLILQLGIPCSIFAAAIGEFTSVEGAVTQMRATEAIKPVVKSPIQEKDVVITDRASSAMMTFSDDSTITLSQNSKLEINQFLFKKQSRAAVFLLSIGQLTATVGKFIGGDNLYEVRSPTCVLGVRGTGFGFIESRDEDRTKATVSCTEGSLNLSALSDTGAVVSTAVLEAGQMAVITGGVITVSLISAAIATGGGTATAESGLSTGAIIGASAAAIAGTAAAVAAANSGGGGGGGDSHDGTPEPPPASDCTLGASTGEVYYSGDCVYSEVALTGDCLNCSWVQGWVCEDPITTTCHTYYLTNNGYKSPVCDCSDTACIQNSAQLTVDHCK
ncbi:MAG: FecR family protein [Thermodesulfobacteriota bacterium]